MNLVPRVLNFSLKNAKGNPAADLDICFIPELAPGDNFISGETTVVGKTDANGDGSVTLYVYENSFRNFHAEWDGSGGRQPFSLTDEPDDADLGQKLKEAIQNKNLRFTPATLTSLGAVKPDGVTIGIDSNGVIFVLGGSGGLVRGTTTILADGLNKTVTDALVTPGALIKAWLQTNDDTAKSAVAVPGTGNFTIYLDAQATGDVTVGYEVVYA